MQMATASRGAPATVSTPLCPGRWSRSWSDARISRAGSLPTTPALPGRFRVYAKYSYCRGPSRATPCRRISPRMCCVFAVEVGRAINPLGLEAQVMCGTIDGLSTAQNLEITIEGGRVRESNLQLSASGHAGCAGCRGDHRVERARSGWCRRDGDPSAATALANALYAAIGKRIRSLPIRSLPA